MYTYGCPTIDDNNNESRNESCCGGIMLHSVHGSGSSRKRRQRSRTGSLNLHKKPSVPASKVNTVHITFFSLVKFPS